MTDNGLVIVGVNTEYEIKTDVYLKQEYKQLRKSMSAVFGLLDAEACKSRTTMMRVVFLNSILYNIMQRAAIFELNEEEFLEHMRKLYQTYKEAKEKDGMRENIK